MEIRDYHPKRKGALGEAIVAAVLIDQGYPVFTELGDLARTDLIALLPNGSPVKIQVKCFRSKRGVVCLSRRKCGPGYRFVYQPGDVDLFAVYVYDRRILLWVPARVLWEVERTMTLRIDPPKNRQERGIRYASDFRDLNRALKLQGYTSTPVRRSDASNGRDARNRTAGPSAQLPLFGVLETGVQRGQL